MDFKYSDCKYPFVVSTTLNIEFLNSAGGACVAKG